MNCRKKQRSIILILRILPSLLTGVLWEKKREEWLSPVEGVITSACGERVNPILGKRENHNGLDIAVAEGTAVIAVKSGKVTETAGGPAEKKLYKKPPVSRGIRVTSVNISGRKCHRPPASPLPYIPSRTLRRF